jgi:lysophospholipase L1-like esterase
VKANQSRNAVNPRSEYLLKIAVSAASLLLTLLALEVGLRYTAINPLRDWESDREFILRASAHSDLKYELTPGASGRLSDTGVKVNSQGFREPEPSSRPSGQRVIVLGDSIAFGNFMHWEDTFSSLLQQRLHSDKRGVEVLNFGVGGYDILQEVSLLEIRGLKYRPNLVVVAYCLNDISIASTSLEHIERRRSQQRNVLYRSRLAQFVSTNIEKIRLKNWLSYMNQPEVFRREYEHQIDAISEDEVELLDLMKNAPRWPSTTWYGDRDRVGRLRFAFNRLARISRENNLPVVIMIVPLLISEAGTYSHRPAHRIVEMEARRAGFDTIDLTDAFMRAGMGALKTDFGDIIHPNKRGHAIMADLLSQYVVTHLREDRSPVR